ncbi:MAG: acyl-CoA dehydrogenase family protein [Deltaproteobacteria bacterium]|nr:acyl-CoA dehydrogenase family protein [Deltaproteobacteria bacterium]MBW2123164.1 acyl-CoA dehydrogenase family protein [Deltaproteobacteria bacterium]
MDFGLTPEQEEMRRMARNFAEKRIAPTMEEDEKEHRFRRELVKEMADQGFFACIAPEKYGGLEEGHLAASIMTEEIAAVSPSWGLPFNLQMNAIQSVLLAFGSEEQRQRFIPPLISADTLGCFAITEANSGSDVAGMRTQAVESGDGWVLNGSKMWISGVPVADVGIVFAYTDREKRHRGISAFMVDMHTTGVEQRAIETKLGLFCAPTGEIIFQDAKLPKDSLVGERGAGFKICMSMLDNTRLSSAARAVGVARACFEHSVRYAKEREQFGVPIGQHQMVQEQLAEMYVEHEAARLLVYRAAWIKDQGQRNTLQVSMAKYYAAEVAVRAANEAVKIYGSYGFSSEYPVERFYRDAKSYQIVEGTSNIQKMIIGQYALGMRK